MHPNPRVIAQTARGMQTERAGDRSAAFRRAQERHGAWSRRSGAYAVGRDENGRVKETRKLEAFRIVVDKWYVRMGFKREDRERFDRSPWKEVEETLRAWDVPRKKVMFDTHIITAVRALKHLREGYQKEMEDTERVLGALDLLNAQVAAIKSGHTDQKIDDASAQLQSLDESELARKQVAVKRIVTRGRLAETVRMLETARTLPLGRDRDMQVSRACAVLVSVRNRLGQWRDRQIAGIVEWNHQKECALRVERDQWLFSQLTRFAEFPETIHGHVLFDQNRLRILGEVRRMLREGERKDRILRYLKANHILFRVGERKREGAEEVIARTEAGIPPRPGGAKMDYLIGHYAWLYRFVKNGDKEKAMDKLDYLVLFINANKPRFVWEEIGKGPDPCLQPVIAAMEHAVAAFEGEDFDKAKTHFTQARKALEAFVYPQGVPAAPKPKA